MKTLNIACATDDGKIFSPNHFGDAQRYRVFRADLQTGAINEVEGFANIPFTEEAHGSAAKAQHMGQQLKAHKVQVIAAWAIGANIKKMRLRFVPVISRIHDIEEAMKKLDLQALAREAAKAAGEERSLIKIGSPD